LSESVPVHKRFRQVSYALAPPLLRRGVEEPYTASRACGMLLGATQAEVAGQRALSPHTAWREAHEVGRGTRGGEALRVERRSGRRGARGGRSGARGGSYRAEGQGSESARGAFSYFPPAGMEPSTRTLGPDKGSDLAYLRRCHGVLFGQEELQFEHSTLVGGLRGPQDHDIEMPEVVLRGRGTNSRGCDVHPTPPKPSALTPRRKQRLHERRCQHEDGRTRVAKQPLRLL
jgi:hypothetical protein